MKELMLIRHAKSDWNITSLDDRDRPLNERGQKDALKLGKWLKKIDFIPDKIFVSPALRVQSTLEAILQSIQAPFGVIEKLYPGDYETIIKEIGSIDNNFEKIIVIGHNMGMQEAVSYLAGDSLNLDFPTSAVAWFYSKATDWKTCMKQKMNLKALVIPQILRKKN